MVSLLNEYPYQAESVDIGKKGVMISTEDSVKLLGHFSQQIGTFQYSNCVDAKFSAQESQGLALDGAKLIHFSLDKVKTIREYTDDGAVLAVSSGNLVATGGSVVKLWDIRRRLAIRTTNAHQKGTSSLLFGEGFLLSGGKEGTLKKWDLKANRAIETISRHERIYDIHSEDNKIAVLYKNIVRVYDMQSYENTLTLPVPDTQSCLLYTSDAADE